MRYSAGWFGDAFEHATEVGAVAEAAAGGDVFEDQVVIAEEIFAARCR